jgi:hypothetical protein
MAENVNIYGYLYGRRAKALQYANSSMETARQPTINDDVGPTYSSLGFNFLATD